MIKRALIDERFIVANYLNDYLFVDREHTEYGVCSFPLSSCRQYLFRSLIIRSYASSKILSHLSKNARMLSADQESHIYTPYSVRN